MPKSIGTDSVATVYQVGSTTKGKGPLRRYTATPQPRNDDEETVYHTYEEIASVAGGHSQIVRPPGPARAVLPGHYQRPAPAKTRQSQAKYQTSTAPTTPLHTTTPKTGKTKTKHAKGHKLYQTGQQSTHLTRPQSVPSMMKGNQVYQGGSLLSAPVGIYADEPTSRNAPAPKQTKTKHVAHPKASAQPHPMKKAGSVSSLASFAVPPADAPPAYTPYVASGPPPAYSPRKPASAATVQCRKGLICCCILISLLIIAGMVLPIVFTLAIGNEEPEEIIDSEDPNAVINPDTGFGDRQPDLGGNNPVIPPPPEQRYPEPTVFVCQHEVFDIVCGEHQQIRVLSAMYGRLHPAPCDHFEPDDFTNSCVSPSSLWVVKQHCEGKEECHVLAEDTLFGDPCDGTLKYLTIDFFCEWKIPPRPPDGSDEELPEHFVCEHEHFHIECDGDERIHIIDAMFGRQQQQTPCGYVDSIEYIDCVSPKSLRIVRDYCEGARECEVPADIGVFGDPCQGTRTPMYLAIDFICQLHEPPSDEEPPGDFVCQHEDFHIECDQHEQIHIIHAIFGRQYPYSPCEYVDPDISTDCVSLLSMDVVKDICEGERECEVPADTDLFGDPCRGTPMYLAIDFICERSDRPPPPPPDVERPLPPDADYPQCQPIYFVLVPPDGIERFIMAIDVHYMFVIFKRMESGVCHVKHLDMWDDAFRPSHWTLFDEDINEVIDYFVDVIENCHEDDEINVHEIATVVGDCAVDLCRDVPTFWLKPDEHESYSSSLSEISTAEQSSWDTADHRPHGETGRDHRHDGGTGRDDSRHHGERRGGRNP